MSNIHYIVLIGALWTIYLIFIFLSKSEKEYQKKIKELDKKLEGILSSLDIEINTKDTNYKKLRRTFIKLYLLRFDWIRTLINHTDNIDEDDFRREVDNKLGMSLFPDLQSQTDLP